MRLRLFGRRYGTVRVTFRRLLVDWRRPRAHRVDAGRRQDVRLAARQSYPVTGRLGVAGRLTE